MSAMLSVKEARARILALMTPTGRETVAISSAVNRVLAAPVMALRTQPPFPASAMDGYAVRNTEVTPGASFRVVGEAAAGHPFDGEVPPGCCVRIFTGGAVPAKLDRIIIQEDAQRNDETIRLHEALDDQLYVRPAGLDFTEGRLLLEAPRRLTPEDIALLAAAGVPFVTCHRKPRIAFLATGDELVLPGMPTPPGHIVSSNNFGLAALAETLHAEAIVLPIARDTIPALQEAARDARRADLFVTLGGASVGDHDLIRPALGDAGLDLDLYKIAMRPGKPLMAGMLHSTPMLGLPGNPVSAMVCGRIFLAPAITALSGLSASAPPTVSARLAIPLERNGPREHYMRAITEMRDGTLWCSPFDSQDSSRLGLLARANALAIRPTSDPERETGEQIDIILL